MRGLGQHRFPLPLRPDLLGFTAQSKLSTTTRCGSGRAGSAVWLGSQSPQCYSTLGQWIILRARVCVCGANASGDRYVWQRSGSPRHATCLLRPLHWVKKHPLTPCSVCVCVCCVCVCCVCVCADLNNMPTAAGGSQSTWMHWQRRGPSSWWHWP